MNEALDAKSDTQFEISTSKLAEGDYLLKTWNGLLFYCFLLFVIFVIFEVFGSSRAFMLFGTFCAFCAFWSQGKSMLFCFLGGSYSGN